MFYTYLLSSRNEFLPISFQNIFNLYQWKQRNKAFLIGYRNLITTTLLLLWHVQERCSTLCMYNGILYKISKNIRKPSTIRSFSTIPPLISKNSTTVPRLTSRFESGKLTGAGTPKEVWLSDFEFKRYLLSAFRQRITVLRKQFLTKNGVLFTNFLFFVICIESCILFKYRYLYTIIRGSSST